MRRVFFWRPSVVRRFNLDVNRMRAVWSWITDDSYRSAAGREAGRLTKIISAGGRLSQPGRVNVAAQSVLVQLVALHFC